MVDHPCFVGLGLHSPACKDREENALIDPAQSSPCMCSLEKYSNSGKEAHQELRIAAAVTELPRQPPVQMLHCALLQDRLLCVDAHRLADAL